MEDPPNPSAEAFITLCSFALRLSEDDGQLKSTLTNDERDQERQTLLTHLNTDANYVKVFPSTFLLLLFHVTYDKERKP